MKLLVYKKKKCVVGYLYERDESFRRFQSNGFYEPIPLDEIEDYFVEKTEKGYLLIVENGIQYKNLYVIDIYSTQNAAEAAAKVLFL